MRRLRNLALFAIMPAFPGGLAFVFRWPLDVGVEGARCISDDEPGFIDRIPRTGG